MTTARGTWLVIAHQAGARLMERTREEGGRYELRMVRELDNPEGRKKNSEIDSDRPSMGGARAGVGRHAMPREQSAHEHAAETFAHTLAHELSTARVANQVDQLILVAEPGFLGVLESALDAQTKRLVIGTVPKDLAAVPAHKLLEHLASVQPS